ncbi:Retron-type RNA-directed DNA polymerase [hydrothermal vent metagenome]|uniref:Retron-type RNA-directed DNA polymerase n=1 Tax=hydrothermal vent metagenome TaxID=652676 RepID=A0A3B0YKM0_9ZZZZ
MSESELRGVRQRLFDRIRSETDDQKIHEDMKLLGFWQEEGELSDSEKTLLQRQDELANKLHDLVADEVEALDPENLIKDLRKKQSNKRKVRHRENRAAREQAKRERQHEWTVKNQTEILYLGEGVSSTLNDSTIDVELLQKNKLPVLSTAHDLSHAMGISLAELRFMSFSRKVSTLRHYKQFDMSKKSGGIRRIAAPMPRLKRLQYWILDNILNLLPLHTAAHGFVAGRSIISNAKDHMGSEIVINLDLENFFPTIIYRRVKGLFRSFGYSEQISTILGLICTEFDFEQVKLDGQHYFVGSGERKLPQGAPTSPAISNLICQRLDRRLAGMAKAMAYRYTRYADDLTFSSKSPARPVQKLLWRSRQIIRDEGFIINKPKTRIMRQHRRQEVTGIVINEKMSVNRATRKRLRALVYQIEKSGFENKQWDGKTGLAMLRSIRGMAQFINMVNPAHGKELLTRINQLKYPADVLPGHALPGPLSKKILRKKSAAGEVPRTEWWEPVSKVKDVVEDKPVVEPPKPLKRKSFRARSKPKARDKAKDVGFDKVVQAHYDNLVRPSKKWSWKTLVLVIGLVTAAAFFASQTFL